MLGLRSSFSRSENGNPSVNAFSWKMPVRISYPAGSGEETMTFEDRRDVGGLKLPYRVTTTAAGRVVDVLMFDEIRVNPEIGKGDFKR